MPDVTHETWMWGPAEARVRPQTPIVGPPRPLLGIRLSTAEVSGVEDEILLFSGFGGTLRRAVPEGTGEARARLAASAPILFRMLQKVLDSHECGPELSAAIRVNLHVASPDSYPLGFMEPVERRVAWEFLDSPELDP